MSPNKRIYKGIVMGKGHVGIVCDLLAFTLILDKKPKDDILWGLKGILK